MAALDYLRQAGLVVELEGKRLRVTPASRITDEHRQYLNNHRVALLAELEVANDPQIASIPQQKQAQYVIRTAATASSEWHQSRNLYIGHLMSCRACHAPTVRYCATGAALRQRYDHTSMESTS
ncbi:MULTISPECIES: hypothetical protein [unclassified Pseudomonas]|uniref:hypothetical protein n=1 Tax=unclassified Pseudomonas TaxID=196821 RepID=UPI001A91BA51|nr:MULTISPECIES: hypothetical protein [unclassified Pseudomonas]